MLFLTVYGSELESLFLSIHNWTHKNGGMSIEQIYSTYLPLASTEAKKSTKNIDDAIQYLKDVRLITGEKTYTSLLHDVQLTLPFTVLLLYQFRQLETLTLDLPLIDRLYITLLEQLYIFPNRLWISDVHATANQLDLSQQIGGISQEKIGAWKRVMEFLGVGLRVGNGFYCLYQPALITTLAQNWRKKEATLQEFFDTYLQSWLPCLSARGEVALPLAYTLDQLVQNKRILMYPKQDSPARPYFGARYLKGIKIL